MLYDNPVIQVAFQLPDEDLEAIDALVPDKFSSRAEALRIAVRLWLRQIEEQRIDAALAAGYDLLPPSGEEKAWAEISSEALAGTHLEW
jgi:Arc/MetJ-type ribon-helix-helix transcriptional regulator